MADQNPRAPSPMASSGAFIGAGAKVNENLSPGLGGLTDAVLQGQEVFLALVIDTDDDEYAELSGYPL